jgi:hypothetical protein
MPVTPMPRFLRFLVPTLFAILSYNSAFAQSQPKPFCVAIAGLTHGHVAGFLSSAAKRSDIQIVGVAEPDQQLAHRYAEEYKLDSHLIYATSTRCSSL